MPAVARGLVLWEGWVDDGVGLNIIDIIFTALLDVCRGH